MGHALGTPAFHAPEVCSGMSKIDDAAVDIWALGVSFYTVIYGTLPFEPAPGGGRSAESLILRLYEAIEHAEPAFAVVAAAQKKGRTVVLAPTARLVALLGRMMDKDPTSRITISEIWDHDWMTNNGTDTSGFSKEKRVYQRVSVSHFEVERAISTVDTFMVMVKIKMRWASALKRARARLLANKLKKQTGEGAGAEVEECDEEKGGKDATEYANEERGDRGRQGEGRAASDNKHRSNEEKQDGSVVDVLGTASPPMQRPGRPEALTFKHQAGATVMPQVALTNDVLNKNSIGDEESGKALEPEVTTGEGDAISVYTGGTDEVGSAESAESGMCSSVHDVNDTMGLDELFDVLQKPEEDSAATPTKDRVLYAPAKDFSLCFPPIPGPVPLRWVPPVAGDGMHLLSTATVSNNPYLNITSGAALNQGKRSSMEDFVFAAASLNEWQQGHNEEEEEEGANPENANLPLQLQESNDRTTDFGFFAVFDGHGGDQASEYLSQHLHRHFIKDLAARPGDTERALRGAIANTEELLLSYLVKEKLFCGSTGVVCVVEASVHSSSGLNSTNRGSDETTAPGARRPRRLYCANVGDSRAVLCDAGVAKDLSNDHKLSYGQETQRIIDAGGWVKGSRVCGVLNLARSFGDVEFKTLKDASWDKAFTADLVICEPEVRVVDLDGDGDGCEFVIMASDGVYDVLSSQEAVNFVREALHKNGGDAGGAALELTNYAVKFSADNVAVVVVTLCHEWGR